MLRFWVRKTVPPSDELIKARREYEAAVKRQKEVRRVVKRSQYYIRQNHFAPTVATALRGGKKK